MKRQIAKPEGISSAEVEQFKAAFFRFLYRIKIDFQFSQRRFNHDFGNADRTDINNVGRGLNFLTLLFRNPLRFGQRPEKNMCVQNDSHASSP
jgi:hypothetical protein